MISSLLRDARPTARELEGRPNVLDVRDARFAGREIDDTPDPRKARDAARARDLACAELVRLYCEAKRARALDTLRVDARFFVERLIRMNGGKLPKLRLPPGRPRDRLSNGLVVYLAVLKELDALGPGHGNKTKAIQAVARRHGRSPQDVRDIFYNRHPEWKETVRLELALREEWAQPYIEPPTIEGQKITTKQFDEYLGTGCGGMPQWPDDRR